MKLYGTARSISYYDFEIAGSDGTQARIWFSMSGASPAGIGSAAWAGMSNLWGIIGKKQFRRRLYA